MELGCMNDMGTLVVYNVVGYSDGDEICECE